jgi:hypothetical protein
VVVDIARLAEVHRGERGLAAVAPEPRDQLVGDRLDLEVAVLGGGVDRRVVAQHRARDVAAHARALGGDQRGHVAEVRRAGLGVARELGVAGVERRVAVADRDRREAIVEPDLGVVGLRGDGDQRRRDDPVRLDDAREVALPEPALELEDAEHRHDRHRAAGGGQRALGGGVVDVGLARGGRLAGPRPCVPHEAIEHGLELDQPEPRAHLAVAPRLGDQLAQRRAVDVAVADREHRRVAGVDDIAGLERGRDRGAQQLDALVERALPR